MNHWTARANDPCHCFPKQCTAIRGCDSVNIHVVHWQLRRVTIACEISHSETKNNLSEMLHPSVGATYTFALALEGCHGALKYLLNPLRGSGAGFERV